MRELMLSHLKERVTYLMVSPELVLASSFVRKSQAQGVTSTTTADQAYPF